MPLSTAQLKSRRIRFSAALLLLAGLLGIAAAAWVQFASLAELRATLDLRAEARDARRLAGEALSLLKDVETGQRGYLLSRREAFLDAYQAGLDAMPEALGSLGEALQPLPLTGWSWQEVKALYAHRAQLARRNVELTRHGHADQATQTARIEEGKRAMDALRDHFAALDEHLVALVALRNQEAQRLLQRTYRLMGLLSALGGLMILAAGWLLWREQRRREAAEAALAAANAGLEDEVADRTAQLQAARLKLEGYARQLDQGVEAERRRLAREVHDRLGQSFTAMKLGLARLAGAEPAARDELERLMDEGIDTARRIAFDLRPAMLEDLGLGLTLEQYARVFCAPSGLTVEVALTDAERLTLEQTLQLYRIAQEALTNVLRHAGAQRVRIRGAVEGHRYLLEIADDGLGINAPPGLGLAGMSERARLAGGALDLGTGELGGARLRVTLPLEMP